MSAPLVIVLIIVVAVLLILLYRRLQSQNTSHETQNPSPPVEIRDSITGELVSDEQVPVATQLSANLPEDVIKLAARNKAFLDAILILQRQELDEDLFLEAIDDLRSKYYKNVN